MCVHLHITVYTVRLCLWYSRTIGRGCLTTTGPCRTADVYQPASNIYMYRYIACSCMYQPPYIYIIQYIHDLLNTYKSTRLNPLMHGRFQGAVRPLLLWFLLPFTQKNLKTEHTWKFLTFPNFLLRMPPWRKKSKNLVLPSLRALLFWVGKIAHALEGCLGFNMCICPH